MMMITGTMDIHIEQTRESRIAEMEQGQARFGKSFGDHMFIANFNGKEWVRPRIIPYQDLVFSPANLTLHYGQSIFEGMKAYKNDDGEVVLFRPEENVKRLNKSAKRLAMPEIPEDIFMEGLQQLLQLDKAWVPSQYGTSLYIRPFMFATDAYIGVKPSETYQFMIITSPAVHGYYDEPVKVKIETEYIRAAAGGVGYAKAAGNYAKSLYPARLAQQQGYHQLIWTDAQEHKFVEEAGTMNVFALIDDVLITPAVSDSILDGITRKSVVQIAKDWDIQVEERALSVDELVNAHQNGGLQELFGTGTAVTIAPIALFNYKDTDYPLPEVGEGSLSTRINSYLNDLRKGHAQDPYGWLIRL